MDRIAQKEARPRLYVNCIAELDWLIALEFGRVDEGQPEDAWRGVSEQLGYLYDGERCVGFKLLGLSSFDIDADENAAAWDAPWFDAPTLALTAASAGEVILAARVHFGERSSINRHHFNRAIDVENGAEAFAEWACCAESGDAMAHYGLGIALYEAGERARAYTHLRFYATIAPREPWAQYWYARAALAIGEVAEAAVAAETALKLASDENLRDLAVTLRALIADGEVG